MSDIILALALLKANWEERRLSYIDNFNLLVAECLRKSTEDLVSSQKIQGSILSLFGLKLPLRTIDILLKRAKKTGFVTRKHGVYYINRTVVNKIQFEEKRMQFIKVFDDLIRDLTLFAKDKFDINWSTDDAEGALHEYLSKNTLTLIRAAAYGSFIPLPKKARKSDRYIFSSYVNHLAAQKSPRLDSLSTVVEGSMLAGAIFFQGTTTTSKFHKTRVYLDTKFLLNAIGYAGESLQSPRRELLDLLWISGAELCCFEHTVYEMESILRGCAQNLRAGEVSPGYGSSFEYFFMKGFNESDVLLFATRLSKDLNRLRVKLFSKPPYNPDYMVDESVLEKHLRNYIQYLHPIARHRDVDSISAIVRLRKGRTPRSLEKSGAIFVTSNTGVVKAATDFLRTDEELYTVPLVIWDWDLTNILWVKNPVTAPDLPKKRIISDCYAAVQPDERFRKRYLDEIIKLESVGELNNDDVFLLRKSLETQRLAMDLTVGDEEAFTEGTIKEVLEIYDERIRAEERAVREAAELRANKLKAELDQQHHKDVMRIIIVEDRATQVAQLLSNSVFFLTVIAAMLVVFFATPALSGTSISVLGISLQWITAVVAGIITIIGWTIESPLLRMKRKLEVIITHRLIHIFKWISGLD